MKKILAVILSLAVCINSVSATSFLSQNCGYDSNNNLVCSEYYSTQKTIDNAFTKFLRKYSGTTLISKLNNLKTNINFKKLELIGSQKYNSQVQFILEYLLYKTNSSLGISTGIEPTSSTQNENNTSEQSITISQINPNSGNINVIAGSSNIYVLRFQIANNSDKEITFDGFGISSNGFDSFRLYVNSTQSYASQNTSLGTKLNNVGITVGKYTTKQFDVFGYVNSSYNGTVNISLNNFSIKDKNGNSLSFSLNQTINQNVNILASSTSSTSSSSTSSSSSSSTTYTTSSQNPAARVIAGNQDSLIELGFFKFKIKYMDSLLQNLTVVNLGTNTATEVTSSNALSLASTDADSLISRLYLYSATGAELASASMVNGIATFNLQNIVIPVNQEFAVIVKAKINKVYNTEYDNKPLKLGMLRIGDCVNGMCTKILFKDTGEMVIPQALANFDSKILNVQYLRNSMLYISSLAQSSTNLAGSANIWGFTAGPVGGNATLKEFKFNVFIYDAGTQGFYLDGSAFSLFINNQRISNSDISFYNAEGSCNGLNGNQITGQGNLTGVLNTTKQYCVKVVFNGSYANGYDMSQNGSYQFKIYNDSKSVSDDDSLTTNMSQYGGYIDMNSYDTLKNTPTSAVWSDKTIDNLQTYTNNRFSDAYMGLDTMNSWSLRL